MGDEEVVAPGRGRLDRDLLKGVDLARLTPAAAAADQHQPEAVDELAVGALGRRRVGPRERGAQRRRREHFDAHAEHLALRRAQRRRGGEGARLPRAGARVEHPHHRGGRIGVAERQHTAELDPPKPLRIVGRRDRLGRLRRAAAAARQRHGRLHDQRAQQRRRRLETEAAVGRAVDVPAVDKVLPRERREAGDERRRLRRADANFDAALLGDARPAALGGGKDGRARRDHLRREAAV